MKTRPIIIQINNLSKNENHVVKVNFDVGRFSCAFRLFFHQKTVYKFKCGWVFLFILHFFFLNCRVLAQGAVTSENSSIESLKLRLTRANDDSSRIMIMDGLGFDYEPINIDSSLKYSYAALALARERNYAWGEARLLASLSGVLLQQGKFAEALDVVFQSLKIAESNNLPRETARAYRRLSAVYDEMENYPKSIEYCLRALKIDELNNYERSAAIDHMALARAYYRNKNLDSANWHLGIAFKRKDFLEDEIRGVYEIAGDIQNDKKNYPQALTYYRLGYGVSQKISDFRGLSQFSAAISSLYNKLGNLDSAQFYALKGFEYAQQVSFKKGIVLSGTLLSELYDSIQPALALKYFRLAAGAKDSLFGATHIMTIQNQISREQARQNEMEAAELSYRNKLRLYGLLAGIAALFIIVFFLYRNNKQKQKANIILENQKIQIELTLKELKSTQAQLIQSEKMASLGQLTAGIAHEIQNPLNFVNNFSELNKELIQEAKEGLVNGDIAETLVILNDLEDNSEKITLHGKRADAIVKGMLEHSKRGSGQKQETDINALADEFLRLSYQSYLAKDKEFYAELQLNLDPNLPKISVIPQDIGKVLLNLFSNAFYAVSERAKSNQAKEGGEKYSPTVSLSTKIDKSLLGELGVIISVKDNGPGIPNSIKDKIFQPFFTTKPTGSGTGLGLSLSYDIVKAHGGELMVLTEEGEGSEFIIQIPINSNRG